jgi:DNA primase
MVISISKISDRIKREIYIQECSRIMDISEEVLFNTLAQMDKKDVSEANKKFKETQKSFNVVKNTETASKAKVDIQFELEHKIIQILLLYGNVEQEFEDVLLKTDEEGELKEVLEKNNVKVFQRIYLSLQEDEIELSNPLFLKIYKDIMDFYHQNENFVLEQYLMRLDEELAQEVTTVLMNEEREVLHNWESQNIIVKQKNESIAQYVTETILTLRWYWVNNIIDDLKNQVTLNKVEDNSEALSMVMDYLGLTNMFSKKLGRVISRYS